MNIILLIGVFFISGGAAQQCEAPFDRDNYDRKSCHDVNCDGAGHICVDSSNKVTSTCQCSHCNDIRVIMAAVGEYCDENGRWSPENANLDVKYNSESERAAKIKADTHDFGFVEAISGKNGIKYKCASTCWGNRTTEMNTGQRRLDTSNLRKGLKASSVADYNDYGSDTCRNKDCALCTKCKIEASEKRFGFVPLINTFLDSKGVSQHQGGCSVACNNKFEGSVHNSNINKRSFAIKVVPGMQERTKAEADAANAAGFDTMDVTGANYGGETANFYSVDGEISRTIFAVAGATYTFNKDASMSGHPLVFRKLDDGTVYSTTNVVTMPAAGTHLEYYCSNHIGMGGIIKVFTAPVIKKILTCDNGACSSCKVCNDLYGTDEIDENTTPTPTNTDPTKPVDLFVPHAPDEDVNGDGSKIAGGCISWCEKNYREIGQIWPVLRNKLDIDEPYNSTGQYATRDEARENNVCGWLRCSGCPMCLKKAATTTNDFFHKESIADYTGSKYERTKEARLGGCQVRLNGVNNCKTIWNTLNDVSEKDVYCTERRSNGVDCTGCPICKKYTTERYPTPTKNKKNSRVVDTVNNFDTRKHRKSGVVKRNCPPQLFCEKGISKYVEICGLCYD